jgi:hypothetical protein
MIAAEDDGHFPALKDFLHLYAEVFAGVANLTQVLQLFTGFGWLLWALDAQVSQVAHFIAKLGYTLVEMSHAHRRRAYVHAFKAATES